MEAHGDYMEKMWDKRTEQAVIGPLWLVTTLVTEEACMVLRCCELL